MQIETDGIVLREQNTGENDRVVTLLTAENGIVHAFAKGSRRLHSNSAAATQLFCYSHFVIFRGRDAYTIDSAETIQMFFDLRKDLETTALSQYFCELALALCEEEKESKEQLRLLLNGFYLLQQKKKSPLQIKAAVEMRLLSLAGYQPNLVACEKCGTYETETMFFALKDGVLLCENCRQSDRRPTSVQPISRGVLTALRYLVYAPFGKLFSFSLSEEGIRQLARITEQFLLVQLERSFKTLQFYHQIPK